MREEEISEGEYLEHHPELETQPEPAPLAKVEQKVAELAKASSGVPTIAAERLADVLPVSFYEGNSQLAVSDEERDVLKQFRDAPDDDLEIRPEGLVYAGHMFYRNALTDAFGPGGWSLLPGSGIQIERNGDRVHIFQRWVLRVHGAFVGEAIGSGSYFANNAAQDKSDAAEAAASNALMRICAKSSLGIGTNPWNRRFQREWKRKYAIQVWVKGYKGMEKRWRRKDDDPLPNETGPVDNEQHIVGSVSGAKDAAQPAAEPVSQGATTATSGKVTGTSPSPAKAAPPPPPPSVARGEAKGSKVPSSSGQPVRRADKGPSAASPLPPKPEFPGDIHDDGKRIPGPPPRVTDRVGEPEWRYWMTLCRQKGLVKYNDETKADDATAAYSWLCEFLAVDPGEGTGKTVIERMRALYLGRSLAEHREKIVPALKQLEGLWGG